MDEENISQEFKVKDIDERKNMSLKKQTKII